jgi:putative flavoprotein involved in K+ transport
MRKSLDAIVIGGGQAGLAMGRELSQRGMETLILEARPRIGSAWRSRWDSLRLFTPARYSALPGLPFPGGPDHYPTRDEVVAYLEAYVRAFDLPLALDEPVRDVRPTSPGGFVVTTDYRRYRARQVVVATGPFQSPRVPPFATMLPRAVHQLHSSAYRNPAELPDGPVLVVGGGNSGVQIAAELAATRPVTLAVGSGLRRLPARVLGRSIFEWLDRAGAMSVSVETWLGRRASRKELLIGESPATIAESHGVRILPRAVGVTGAGVVTSDGTVTATGTVIWATGHRPDYPWLHAPVWSADRKLVHHRGVTRVPGLHFLGLSWQHTRGSALLGWVGRDAEHLGDRMGTVGRARHKSQRPLHLHRSRRRLHDVEAP